MSTLRGLPQLLPRIATRGFATSRAQFAPNQIFEPIRTPTALKSHQNLATTSNIPLLTIWTTSFCPTCRVVSPLLHTLITSGLGEAEGGVAFAEVQYDAPEIMKGGLGMRYAITAIPTLMSFDSRGEVVTESRVVDGRRMGDRGFLEEWVRGEARRFKSGNGGGGNGFEGLWKGWK